MNQENYQNRPTMAKWNEMVQAVGAMPRFEWGSYMGTGQNGWSYHNSLSFDFTPKLVLVFNYRGHDQSDADYGVILWGVTDTLRIRQGYGNQVSYSENTVSWYNTGENVPAQLNVSGQTYRFLAIG